MCPVINLPVRLARVNRSMSIVQAVLFFLDASAIGIARNLFREGINFDQSVLSQ